MEGGREGDISGGTIRDIERIAKCSVEGQNGSVLANART